MTTQLQLINIIIINFLLKKFKSCSQLHCTHYTFLSHIIHFYHTESIFKLHNVLYTILKNPTITETITLNRLCWFGHVLRMEENRIPKRVLHMNLGTTRLRGRPRKRCQDEVWEDGRIVGAEGWQEKVHDREEWKKLLGTASNCLIQHTPMEWMNEMWLNGDNTKLPQCHNFYVHFWRMSFADSRPGDKQRAN